MAGSWLPSHTLGIPKSWVTSRTQTFFSPGGKQVGQGHHLGPASEGWSGKSVIPPDGHGIALDEFQQAVEHRLFQAGAGATAIGVSQSEPDAGVADHPIIGIIEQSRWQITAYRPGEGPGRRPIDLRLLLKRRTNLSSILVRAQK